MVYVYILVALAVLGVNDYLVYKYGQKVVLKAVQRYHSVITMGSNARSDVATVISKLKADFHL